MLLFTDGFERFHPSALSYKWPIFFFTCPDTCSSFTSDNINVHVVSSVDSKGKPYARKDGRALRFTCKASASNTYPACVLGTSFRKSRNIFLGFASRFSTSGSSIIINFFSRTYQHRTAGINPPFYNSNRFSTLLPSSVNVPWLSGGVYGVKSSLASFGSLATDFPPVATLWLKIIDSTHVQCTWYFPNGTSKLYVHDVSGSLVNGDYRYFQVGLGVSGATGSQPSGRCETRIGNRGNNIALDNLAMYDVGSSFGYYVDSLTIALVGPIGDSSNTICLDDVYICNDEGSVNNNFLGNCLVKSVVPELDGSHNIGEIINAGPTHVSCVASDFFGSVPMPNPVPDPATNPDFIPWDLIGDSSILLKTEGDKQSFRFSNPTFSGSEPTIFGVCAHAVSRTTIANHGKTSITPFIRSFGNYLFGVQEHFPLSPYYSSRYLVIENNDLAWIRPGFVSDWFNTLALSGVEFGYSLSRTENDLYFSSPSVIRYNVKYDDTIYDFLSADDFSHRHVDESIVDSFNAHTDPFYEYVFAVYESFDIGLFDSVARACNFYLWDNYTFSSFIPDVDEVVSESISFSLDCFNVYQFDISSDMHFSSWSTPYGYEEVKEFFDISPILVITIVAVAESSIDLSLYIDNNFEDVNSDLETFVSYIFSGHEFADSYLHFDEFTVAAHVLIVGDFIVFEEEHYDGNLVEVPQEQFSLGDSVLTQHWRHEYMFFVCISSYQVYPIEQVGNDGNKAGNLISQNY